MSRHRYSNGWKPWPPERVALLRANYATMDWPELMQLLNATRLSIKNQAQKMGLSRPRKQHRWTPAQLEYLEKHFATESAVGMARRWGVQPCVVYGKAKAMGLEKAPDFLSKFAKATDLPGRGTAHRIRAGAVPPNKGRKMSPAQYAVMARTMFKKGAAPANRAPLGATRVNPDGYLVRKIASTGYPPDDWKAVHRLVWIEHHGPIPRGQVVCFKPGRRTTVEAEITIDALECISQRENMARNTVHNLPAELKSTIQTKGILKRMINQRIKKDEQEHDR